MDMQSKLVTHIAGDPKNMEEFFGDGGDPLLATFSLPRGIAITPDGEIIIADCWNHRFRKISKDGSTISTIAGCGKEGYGGDGGLAIHASLNNPWGVAVDGEGNILFTDWYNHRVRRIDRHSQIITTIAGSGPTGWLMDSEDGNVGDGGAATDARLKSPRSIGVMKEGGHIIIADFGDNRIRKVDGVSGTISTIAGAGEEGYSGDGGPAIQAMLDHPHGIAIRDDGSITLCDLQGALRILEPTITNF